MENQEPKDKPAATSPEVEKESFLFPPITDKTIAFQLPNTGDIWLGFNPSKFPLRVILAWCAFQVEQYYAQFMSRVQEAREAAQQPKHKKSIRDILTFH